MAPTSVSMADYKKIRTCIPDLEHRAFQTYVQRGLEMLKNGQKQLKSSRTENILNSFVPVSLDYLFSEGNLY